jgi:hypothetical protein
VSGGEPAACRALRALGAATGAERVQNEGPNRGSCALGAEPSRPPARSASAAAESRRRTKASRGHLRENPSSGLKPLGAWSRSDRLRRKPTAAGPARRLHGRHREARTYAVLGSSLINLARARSWPSSSSCADGACRTCPERFSPAWCADHPFPSLYSFHLPTLFPNDGGDSRRRLLRRLPPASGHQRRRDDEEHQH